MTAIAWIFFCICTICASIIYLLPVAAIAPQPTPTNMHTPTTLSPDSSFQCEPQLGIKLRRPLTDPIIGVVEIKPMSVPFLWKGTVYDTATGHASHVWLEFQGRQHCIAITGIFEGFQIMDITNHTLNVKSTEQPNILSLQITP